MQKPAWSCPVGSTYTCGLHCRLYTCSKKGRYHLSEQHRLLYVELLKSQDPLGGPLPATLLLSGQR